MSILRGNDDPVLEPLNVEEGETIVNRSKWETARVLLEIGLPSTLSRFFTVAVR
jgi:hypothetical protein